MLFPLITGHRITATQSNKQHRGRKVLRYLLFPITRCGGWSCERDGRRALITDLDPEFYDDQASARRMGSAGVTITEEHDWRVRERIKVSGRNECARRAGGEEHGPVPQIRDGTSRELDLAKGCRHHARWLIHHLRAPLSPPSAFIRTVPQTTCCGGRAEYTREERGGAAGDGYSFCADGWRGAMKARWRSSNSVDVVAGGSEKFGVRPANLLDVGRGWWKSGGNRLGTSRVNPTVVASRLEADDTAGVCEVHGIGVSKRSSRSRRV
ncbi:hypothetical protein R3P38DRAFT_2797545 [Favolaschia claudopus]|uniref:Uncharacterized protein n=1 Tax=Favolaschia claudopus TaxID=2862362 RepID=A0AAW0A2Z3_9AGAR